MVQLQAHDQVIGVFLEDESISSVACLFFLAGLGMDVTQGQRKPRPGVFSIFLVALVFRSRRTLTGKL